MRSEKLALSVANDNAHGAAGAGYHADGGFDVGAVEVGHLLLGDLADVFLADSCDLVSLRNAGLEEAEHAAKFAELLGEVVTDSTKKNLQMRVDAENGATDGKFQLAKLAKQYNLDAIHDTVHEMARDEARHGKAFEGLLNRYFNK